MPAFHYVGIDASGKNLDGLINAEGLQAAIGILKGKGYFLTEITPARRQKSAGKTSTTRKTGKPKASGLNFSFGPVGLKPKNRTMLTRQLATLIASGLPLLRSLRVLRDQQKGPSAEIFNNLADDIEAGSLFSQALAKYPKTFPKVYIAMVKAGEAGGALDSALRRLADFGESEIKLKGKIKSAMMYPIIVVFVSGGIVTFIMFKIIPIFVKIFADMEAGSLPGTTRLLIHMSNIITQKAYLVVITVVALLIFYKLLNKWKKTKYLIDKTKLKMFVLGPVIMKTIMARFSRTTSRIHHQVSTNTIRPACRRTPAGSWSGRSLYRISTRTATTMTPWFQRRLETSCFGTLPLTTSTSKGESRRMELTASCGWSRTTPVRHLEAGKTFGLFRLS